MIFHSRLVQKHSFLMIKMSLLKTRKIYQIFLIQKCLAFDYDIYVCISYIVLRSLIRNDISCDVLRQSVNCLFAFNVSQSTVNSDGG